MLGRANPCLLVGVVALAGAGCTVRGSEPLSTHGGWTYPDGASIFPDGGSIRSDGQPSTCGDGVVQPGEWCDDGNLAIGDGCENDCGRGPCWGAAQCPAAAPSCSLRDGTGIVRCRPESVGAPLGAACSGDEECASGWCHAVQQRCTTRCGRDEECAGSPNAWCLQSSARPLGYDGPWETGVCAFGCVRESDCPALTTCTLALTRSLTYFASWCAPETSAARPGDVCGTTTDTWCAQGWCDHWDGDRCTLVCSDDLDCPSVLPHCIELPPSATGARPDGWTTPARICSTRTS